MCILFLYTNHLSEHRTLFELLQIRYLFHLVFKTLFIVCCIEILLHKKSFVSFLQKLSPILLLRSKYGLFFYKTSELNRVFRGL